jgi:hypothetical protein
MSARAVVLGSAELAKDGKSESVALAGAVVRVGSLFGFAGDAIEGTLAAAAVAFCVEASAAGLAAVVAATAETFGAAGSALAADAVDEPLPESPSKNLAAAVKSEKVATLKSPAACAVAVAAGVCVDDVNSSAAFAEGTVESEDFEVLAPCSVVGALSAELCSVCGCD